MSDRFAICYHAVSETWPAVLSITSRQLDRQLEYLSRRGYAGLPAAEALSSTARTPVVALTFDDAYRSVLTRAKPILDRYGMRASVYVPTDWIGRGEPMTWPGIEQWLGGPHEPELACMGWDELRELAGAGWEIGSHTRSHPRLAEIDDEAKLADELEGSRQVLEDGMGGPCVSIAYPYGSHDERVVAAAERAGYELGLTLPFAFPRPRPLAWPRLGIYHPDAEWRWRLKISRPVRALRRTPVWGALAGLRG